MGRGRQRKETARLEGGRAHAAAAQENCESFEAADRCHLHVSAVHVASNRGRGRERRRGSGMGEEEWRRGWEGRLLICSHISIQKN